MATMLSCHSSKEQRIIGLKLYEYNNDFAALIDEWKNIGINTVFIDENLIQKPDFMQLCADNGIATCFIARTFWNPERLAEDSTLYAITSKGEKAIDDWVHFVCPTREEYRNEKIQYFTDMVKKYNPTGISIDFIRYFAFWEMVYPDASFDSIPNTCFCDECLAKFQQYGNFTIPENLIGT